MLATTEQIDVVLHRSGELLSVELTGLRVASVEADEGFPWRKGTRYEVAGGNLIRFRKRRKDETREEVITNWQDWVDYWAVCFDYGAVQEDRPGYQAGPVFTSDWQEFRTRGNRSMAFRSPERRH